MPTVSLDLTNIEGRLQRLYGERASESLRLIRDAISQSGPGERRQTRDARWDQSDVVLITYGDQVLSETQNPLQTLHTFLLDSCLQAMISTVHFLPCFPYTSDDGFSVVDYRKIDPNLGSWDDIHQINRNFKLMLDFVVNHVSQDSKWFQDYRKGIAPYDRFFIAVDPATDLTRVTRPRSLPLLSDFETNRGTQWVWTTFSRDQVDLNYAEPAVLSEMVQILLEYIAHGATIIRLDAIAYLWKQIGTNCIHLPETHEVVKLLREILDQLAPDVLLLTETNVPHQENVSYFGDGDEAHMVYQFSLPPLLIDAFLNDDAQPLKNWLANLSSPPAGATYFNFTASHDGIGVRPLEGHISEERLSALVQKVHERGGLIGTRRNADGTDSPYELNISYVDAVAPDNRDIDVHAKRFLTSQAIMMALQGMPAIYFHSLVGTQNDATAARESGIPRRINRRKFQLNELTSRISKRGTLPCIIFQGMQDLLKIRVKQPALHPDASQRYVETGCPNLLAFERTDEMSGQSILVVANFGEAEQRYALPSEFRNAGDLLGEDVASPSPDEIVLEHAQVVWLTTRN